MTRDSFARMAREALAEVLDELGYPKSNRRRLCGWLFFPPPQDRDDTEFCGDYADGREGFLRICLTREVSDENGKAELKRQLLEHGVVPGVDYIRPSE
jgi:hypothetical protein